MAQPTIDEIRSKLEALALPLAGQAGLELVELKARLRNRDVNIEIIADRPQGGITIGECAALNKAVVAEIDAQGFLGEDYTLELSSPGLDRPLTSAKDFARNLNYEVHFWLTVPVEAKREYTGILTAVDQETVTVQLKKKNTIVLPLAQIEKGLLVIR